MNIYKISQTENRGYDTYDSAVIVADSEAEARNVHPSGFTNWDSSTWCNNPQKVTVELIGIAKPDSYINKEIICASFNAG